MSSNENPEGSAVQQIAAAAMTEPKTRSNLVPLSNPEFVYNTYAAEILKGKKMRSSGWIHGPAQLRLLRTAYERLLKVSQWKGDAHKSVTHVRAARQKGTQAIYIWPADPNDPEAIPVTGGNGSSRWINLITLLAPEGLALPTGVRERYAIDYAGPESPVGPALVFDMGRVLERRHKGKKSAAQPLDTNT